MYLKLESAWKESLMEFTYSELRDTFPEAKHLLKKKLQTEIDVAREDLKTAERIEKEAGDIIFRKSPKEDEWFWYGVVDELLVKPWRVGRQTLITRNTARLMQLSGKIESLISDEAIAHAKQFPIAELIEFRYGVARCIFHTERTGSLHYYRRQNRTWCFGCNKGYDAIDIYMRLNDGVSFFNAVKALQ